MPPSYSVIILSAGFSTRMGRDKLFLQYDNHHTFMEKLISEYKNFGCGEIVLVINKKLDLKIKSSSFKNLKGVRFVINKRVQSGKYYSVKLGLNQLGENTGKTYCFIQDIDHPFTDSPLLNTLTNIQDFEYSVPVFNNRGGHPILLGPQVIEMLKKTRVNELTLKDVLKNSKRKNIEVNTDSILKNINSPKTYIKHFGSELWNKHKEQQNHFF